MSLAFHLDKGSDSLHSTGGISLIGQVLKHCKIEHIFRDNSLKGFQFQDHDILKSLIGILAQGREKFTDITPFRTNKVFMKSLGLKAVPSEESLRQRLEMMVESHGDLLRQSNLELLKKVDFEIIKKGGMIFIPVDADVSPLDNSGSKRENLGYTYKGHDGFAPMFAYIGSEGYMLDHELRPGQQHSQKGMPEFLGGLFESLKSLNLKAPALLRLDSAHDAADNFGVFEKYSELGFYFIIKRNLRKEMKESYLDLARRTGRKIESGEGKNVFYGELHHRNPQNDEKLPAVPMIYKVTERLTDLQGDELLIPEVEVETYWTNLPLEAEEVIELYHEHGTSEQYHSELKTDMNVERLPSGKFGANKLYLACAMLAFNTLRIIGQLMVKNKKLAPIRIRGLRRRLRTVIRDIIFIACKHVKHSGKNTLKFGRDCPWFKLFKKISTQL